MNSEEIKLLCTNPATKQENVQACLFVDSFVALCHLIDDIVDDDKPVTDGDIIKAVLSWTLTLSENQFYVAHKSAFNSLIIQAFNAWLDSNQWEDSEDLRARQSSDVIKGIYHEVVFHAAFLCGGWDHQRAMTSQFRKYDYDH